MLCGVWPLARLELEELELGFNQVSSSGAVALSKALCSGVGPRRLGLAGNGLGDGGAVAMAKALSRLEELRLGSCGIGELGGRALAQAMRSNWSLKRLELTGNEVSQEAVQWGF